MSQAVPGTTTSLARSYTQHSKHAAAFNFHLNLVLFKWQIQDLNEALWSLVSVVQVLFSSLDGFLAGVGG